MNIFPNHTALKEALRRKGDHDLGGAKQLGYIRTARSSKFE
jgi:hypothetical protein